MKDVFIIPLNGLKTGKTGFSWRAGLEFFRQFGNGDIKEAEISVEATVEKSGSYLGVDAGLVGSLTVMCDRCGDDVALPVNTGFHLSIKFGDEPADGEVAEETDGRETVYMSDEGQDIDLGQTVYDYAYLSLPMQRVHPEGECNPIALEYLTDRPGNEEAGEDAAESNPFSVLKGLFEDGKGTEDE